LEAFKFLTINGFGSTSRKVEELETKFTEQLRAMTEIITALRNENQQLKQNQRTLESGQNSMSKMLDNLTLDIDEIQKRLKIKPKPMRTID
jgi:chromosome segregation ATPase